MKGRIEVKTADLTGKTLDWAVAIATKGEVLVYPDGGFCPPEGSVSLNTDDSTLWLNDGERNEEAWSPSTDWAQAGPLIDANSFEVTKECGGWAAIRERYCGEPIRWWPEGETIQVAVCRAIVAAKFGDEVMVPKELVQ